MFFFSKKVVRLESCYKSELHHWMNHALRDKSRACVEITRQLHGKRVYAANLRMLIIPLGSFVYFQIPSFVGLELRQCLCLIWPKGKITCDVIKKMDTALFWQKQLSIYFIWIHKIHKLYSNLCNSKTTDSQLNIWCRNFIWAAFLSDCLEEV